MEIDIIKRWSFNFDMYLRKAIEAMRKDDYLKKIIAQIKLDMFNDNTHNWEPLKESTIKRKKYLANLGQIPEENIDKINVRTGDMKSAFSNAAKVKIDSDFNVSFQYDANIARKVELAKNLNRNPDEFTDEEFLVIIEYVANELCAKLKERYG